jgi:peptidyl-prolyl cis-trans isomerase D
MAAIFRRMSKSKIGTGLMVFVLLAILAGFALQDIRSVGSGTMGFSPGTLAKIGGTQVTERELSNTLQRRLSELREKNPEADYSDLAGDFGRILNGLIQGKSLLEFARAHEVQVSKAMIDAEIVKIPSTRGLNGKFSEQAYAAFLQQQRTTDAELRDAIGSALATRLLLAPAAANARVPVGVATPYASMMLEAREAEVAIVPAGIFAAGVPNPTDADLQAFYKQNGNRYMVPEQRVLSIASINDTQVAKVAASDEEIAAYYKANQQTYGGAETRVLSQTIIPNEAAARALAQKARAGGSAGAALKPMTRDEFADVAGDEVAAAAFRAKQGEIIGPVRSDLGWHVIKVDSIKPASGKSLAQAKPEIAAKLNADKKKEALETLVDKVQTAIDDGASLAEAAKAGGLQVIRTPAITAGGVARSQPGFKLDPDLAQAVKAGFDLAAGDEPVVETLPNGAGYALVGVEDVVAAAPAPLASIRDQVVADWKAKQARDKARAVATAIADRAAKGADMKAAVDAAGVQLPAPQKVAKRRIELAAAGGKVPPALGMMFSLAQGRSRMIADPGGRGFVIVKVTKIIPGNASLQPGLISRTQSEFQQTVPNEYAEQMSKAIEAAVKVKRNEEAIAAAKKRITGGGSN